MGTQDWSSVLAWLRVTRATVDSVRRDQVALTFKFWTLNVPGMFLHL